MGVAVGLGLGLMLLAAASAVAQLFAMLASGDLYSVSLGSIWYGMHANSLIGFQGLIERRIDPLAWEPFQLLLAAPAGVVLGLPGLLLFFSGRRTSRHGFG